VRFPYFVIVVYHVKYQLSSERGGGAATHLHLKRHSQKWHVFAHTQIWANLTSFNK